MLKSPLTSVLNSLKGGNKPCDRQFWSSLRPTKNQRKSAGAQLTKLSSNSSSKQGHIRAGNTTALFFILFARKLLEPAAAGFW